MSDENKTTPSRPMPNNIPASKTTDLPATLREYRAATHGHLTATLTVAADEIERLRAILDSPPTDAMIRAALDEPQAGDESMYHRIWRAMVRESATEIERLRAGWLRSIQTENSCPATGQPCREPCGCVLEQDELMEAAT
jgi:hypothetical protein